MPEIILNLTIVPVGPRARFPAAEGERWRFALQVSAGFDEEPTEAERLACARAMLPWRLLHDADTPIDVRWRTFRTDQTGTAGDTSHASTAPALDLRTAAQAVDLRTKVAEEWETFALLGQPPRSFVVATNGAPVESSNDGMLLPSVLQALGGAVPALTSGTLRCTWYFDIPVTPELIADINATQGGPLRIAAWPVEFTDARGPAQFRFDETAQFVFDGPVVRIPYRDGGSGLTVPRAQTLPFLYARLDAPDEDVLDTYWLPANDSRLDSLAEVEIVVREALSARGRINSLTPELLASELVVPGNSNDPIADARVFLDIGRRVFDVDEKPVESALVRHVTAEATRLSKENGVPLLDQLRVTLAARAAAWWPGAVMLVNERAVQERIPKQWPAGNAVALFLPFLSLLLPATTPEIKPVLPNEGIDVLLGTPSNRLRHGDAEAHDATGNDSDHAQIAAFGVLVRRARTRPGLTQRAWSLATASLAVLDAQREMDAVERYWGSAVDSDDPQSDETLPYDRRPVVRGAESAFVNGLAGTDITYRGTPLAAATVGSVLHGYEGEDSIAKALAELLPLSYQAVGPVRERVQHNSRCLTPPLRYGDWYQFAGFVIDRGGGLPHELSLADHERGPMFDWTKLDPGQLAALDNLEGDCRPVEFLRRVPVGEINVLPAAGTPGTRPEWPALPSGVVLRAREWLAARVQGSESVPALLLSDGASFTRQLAAVSFRATAPVIDEHTLSRWMMPSALEPGGDLAAAETARAVLNGKLADIHRRRDALPKHAPDWIQQQVLPFDPAVSRIGLRSIIVDENGQSDESRELLGVDVTLSLFVRDPGNLPAGSHIALRPGTFAVLELVPLVAQGDYARFESLAMRELIEDDPWLDEKGKPFTAFRPTRVIVEAAADLLPAADDLYQAITLKELTSGAIEVSLAAKNGAALPRMAFVDRFELVRQRWVWRNRPILVPEQVAWQGELPPLLGDEQARDTDISVLRFDSLATLDRGLVDRGRIGGRVPRAADGTPFPAPRLVVDDRDAVSHADYLRFGCTLFSRYEGILAGDRQRVTARATHAGAAAKELEPERVWRRVVAAFRGDITRIKAPKVLAVLPLTHALEGPRPPDVSADATPFLVVLDEIWFREYGPGERLSVEVVLETKEIGEVESDQRPFRVGPLPDHYVNAHVMKPPFIERHLYGKSTDPLQAQPGNRKTFPVFGPFGYSLDRSGNEALANATAFVVYPRAEVRPHYAAYVRMRRILHGIDGTPLQEGPPGGTYALYTQPDAAQLVPADARLRIAAGKHSGARLDLQPLAGPDPEVMKQYRYLLIVGPSLRDLGRGSDLFLPTNAAWVRGDGAVKWIGEELKGVSQTARVLELLLNGRYEPGLAPIERQESLKKVLEALFENKGQPEDAPAMIRRMSHAFAVDVGS